MIDNVKMLTACILTASQHDTSHLYSLTASEGVASLEEIILILNLRKQSIMTSRKNGGHTFLRFEGAGQFRVKIV